MRVYADTNIIVQVYFELGGTSAGRDLLFNEQVKLAWPLPVPDLLKCEVMNAIQRLTFESQKTGQWRVSPEIAAANQGFFESDLSNEVFLKTNCISIQDIEPLFNDLSLRYTAKYGFRTYDIMHVAFALTLGCSKFFSFDKKALQLARLEGLETN